MSISLKNDAGTFSTNINQSNPTENVNITLPTTSGTMAMTSQLGRKNYLINGNFDTWSRGAGGIVVGSVYMYTADMWKSAVNTGAFNVYAATGVGSKYGHAIAQQTTSSTYGFSETYIESLSAAKMVGKTVTLSFKLYNDKGSTFNFDVALSSFNVADVSTARTTIQSTPLTHAGNSAVANYTVTFTNLPASAANGLALTFHYTNGLAVGKVCAIYNVKLEDGSVATDGWHPYDGEFGGEVQACQRYYEVLYFAHNTNTGYVYHYFKSMKRIVPTLTANQSSGTGMPALATVFLDGLYQNAVPTGLGIVRVTASAEL